MPGGNRSLNGSDGKRFSSTYQPANRRKSTKFLTDLLTKNLKGKQEIIVEGISLTDGKKTKVRVVKPGKEQIILALLKQAGRGNVLAIKEIFDRIEGKPLQQNEIGFDWESLSDEQLELIVSRVLSGGKK